MRKALLAGITVLTMAVLAVPSTASATKVISTDDLTRTESLPQLTAAVQAMRSHLQDQYCKFTAPKERRLTESAALKHATAYLDKHSSRAARRAFARSHAAKSEPLAIAAGAAAVADTRPTAALAALLRAHALAPKDPRPLASLAPVLTGLKLPNEALAVLHAAATLKQPKHNPWGIPLNAAIANNRGYALLALKEWRPAATALKQAITRSSQQLSEAELNLAEADLCQGNSAAAARMIFFGVRRSPGLVGDLVQSGAGGPTPTQAGVDVKHGASIVLPTYRYPTDILDGAAMYANFQQLVSQAISPETGMFQQQRALQTQLYKQLEKANPATRRRVNDLVALAGNSAVDPSVSPLSDERSKLFGESEHYESTLMGQAPDCSGGESTHTKWATVVKQLDTATRKEISAEYHLATSVGAYVQQPTGHQLIQLGASINAQQLLALLLDQAQALTQWDDACASSTPTPINPVVKNTDTRNNSAKCPSGLVGKSWTLKLSDAITFALNCDSVSLEAGTKGSWIGVFANVSHNFRDGSTTIFGGPKFTSNPGPWGPTATFKDGLYLTVNSSGLPTGLGGRVEASSSLNLGPAGGAKFSSDTMNFVLVDSSAIANYFSS